MKYRVKEIDNYYYPQYRKFFIWQDFYRYNKEVVKYNSFNEAKNYVIYILDCKKLDDYQYRIIEKENYFVPQYKRFLFWNDVYDTYDYNYTCYFQTTKIAISAIRNHKEKLKVKYYPYLLVE